MTITFRPAVRQDSQILLGLAGPSGSGKTFSALAVASGIQSVTGGEIFGIDTENGRMTHYVGEFQFQHGALDAPFTPEAYMDGIRTAKSAGARIIIIDSMSHEHEGPGGILEQHEAELNRMAGNDWKKRERVKFACWIKPKKAHGLFVNEVLQVDAHFIFCFRAKDKLAMVKNAEGKQEPVSIGWTPICADRFEYEMTSNLILPPGSEGRPDFTAQSTKLPAPLRHIFSQGMQLSRETGRALAEWSRGSALADKPAADANPQPVDPDIQAKARAIAEQGGLDKYRYWFQGLTKEERQAVLPVHDECKRVAEENTFPGDRPMEPA